MGFDQYHEPPERAAPGDADVRAPVRVADRRGRGDRLVSSSAWRSRPIPRRWRSCEDAQGEEFKHFAMDLEFLLRRTPAWREIAQGILFQAGDIVEHGEEAEAEALEEGGAGAAARFDDGSLGIGSLRGASR